MKSLVCILLTLSTSFSFSLASDLEKLALDLTHELVVNRKIMGLHQTISQSNKHSETKHYQIFEIADLNRASENVNKNLAENFNSCVEHKEKTVLKNIRLCGEVIYTGFGVLQLNLDSKISLPTKVNFQGSSVYHSHNQPISNLALWNIGKHCGSDINHSDCKFSNRVYNDNKICLQGSIKSTSLLGHFYSTIDYVELFSKKNICPSAYVFDVN